jgi:hypothetical protein
VPRTIEEPAPRRPPYFWWLLANALALCFAVISWVVCLDVFGNPEVPRNYKILGKLGRLPEMKRYTVLDVPNGSSLSPREIYRQFYALEGERLEKVNSLLMRNYLTNFDRPLLVTYIEGEYQVEQSRLLGEEDFLSPGFAVRAQALVNPDDFTKALPYPVLIEYVFPTEDANAVAAFDVGDILEVKKTPNCAVIVHVAKVNHEGEPTLCITAIPIAYGPYQVGDSRTFGIEPPSNLKPGADFPIFRD